MLMNIRWTCCCLFFLGGAQAVSVTDALKAVSTARREVVAVLPGVNRLDVALALKEAAKQGTVVKIITERARVRGGGYLLNVSHGPQSISTYLIDGRISQPWVMVDGAWVISGTALSQEGSGSLELTQGQANLADLKAWVAQVSRRGPVNRVDILRLYYGKPVKTPQSQSR